MRLSAKSPIVIRGEEITHLDADGYKHLPRATALPDGKVLATSGGKWGASDLSGVSVASVFGRTGAIVAQAGDYTAAQVGAEPYAGAPAQTSFWRSTAAGLRAWVQLVAADITDLATTLAGYLTKADPAFTGTLTGPTATFSGTAQEALRLRRASATLGQIHGVDFQGQTDDLSWANYARMQVRLASTANGAQTGNLRMLVYDAGVSKIALDASPSWVELGAGIGLSLNGAPAIDASRNITGTSLKAAGLAAATVRPATIGADGLLGAQDAATFRGTIGALAASLKGATNGVAELGADGRVPSGQLPSYVDDVLEYANLAAFPATGETGKIYINLDQNRTWRWSGSAYVEISASLALGETSATAYRGDRGKIAYDHSQLTTGNPHGTTAAQVGAMATADPVFTGALKQGGTTRIASGGGAWFASVQSTNLLGAGDRPVAADLTGTLQPKTPAQFRSIISALASSLKGAANGVAELGADVKVPVAQLPSAALLALGSDSTTAHRGDHGTAAYDHSQATGNPHGTTAADVGAMASANPNFTGELQQGGAPRITAGGDGRFASLRASGLAASNTYIPRLDANGGFVASPVKVTPGVGVVFEQAASLQEAGGTWGGSSYTTWTPSAIVPIADDSAGNSMPSLGTGYLWNSQRLNALTITDGAAASPYRGRLRAERWFAYSTLLVQNTTTPTSWFAAGTGDGSPTIPANYIKPGRRISVRGRLICSSCAADTNPEIALKIDSTVVWTQAKSFTISAGNEIIIDVEITMFIDDDGNLIVLSECDFFAYATGAYRIPRGNTLAAFDVTAARAIDLTLKPISTSEVWVRSLAYIEI